MTIKFMKLIIKSLLRLVRFVCFGIWPVPYTSAYKSSEVGYLEIDGERRTMFRMGPVHARDNGPGVSGTEPERTAR